MKKRVLSLCICLALVLALVPMQVLADPAAYPVYVSGIQVTPQNCGDILGDADGDAKTAVYDPESKTLTLNNAALAGLYTGKNSNFSSVIISLDPLNIQLLGKSTVNCAPEGAQDQPVGIFVQNRLTFTGSGSLDVTVTGQHLMQYGIWANDLENTCTGCISVTVPGNEKVCNARALAVTGQFVMDAAIGDQCGSMKLCSGNVTDLYNKGKSSSIGLFCGGLTHLKSGTLTASAGSVTSTVPPASPSTDSTDPIGSYGCWLGDPEGNDACSLIVEPKATLIATGGNNASEAYPSIGIFSRNNMIVGDNSAPPAAAFDIARLTAIGGTSSDSCGIRCKQWLNIRNGLLQLSGGKQAAECYAIGAQNGIVGAVHWEAKDFAFQPQDYLPYSDLLFTKPSVITARTLVVCSPELQNRQVELTLVIDSVKKNVGEADPAFPFRFLNAEGDVICDSTNPNAYRGLPTRAAGEDPGTYEIGAEQLTFAPWLHVTKVVPGTLTITEPLQPDDLFFPPLLLLPASAPFSDVRSGDWFREYVCDLRDRGILDGYPDGTFRPQNNVTYGEALKLVLLSARYGDQAPTAAHWASGYLTKALEDGILPAAVNLDAPIDRLSMARMTARAMGAQPFRGQSVFADCSDPYVMALYDLYILEGSFEDGVRVFLPNSCLTRAEFAAIVYRMGR